MKSIAFAAFGLLFSLPSFAAPIHETWIQEGAATEQQIASWSALPGTRGYLFQLGDPATWALEPILRLRGADRLRLQFTRYPGEDSADVLRQLAARGAELVMLDAGFPTDDEIERLNRIGFGSCVLVMTSFPGEGDGARLSRLRCPTQLTFVTRMYPRFVDKESFLEIPAGIPLLFATDYWPWYSHMDVLNLLPQTIHVRVSDMFPADENYEYLLNIQRLGEIQVNAPFEPWSAGTWDRFGAKPVRWSIAGPIPSETSLAQFADSRRAGGQRSVTIDTEHLVLTSEERARLERLPISVEWIRTAPIGVQF
jgi:hypothetical protein